MSVLMLTAAGQWMDVADLPEVDRLIRAADAAAIEDTLSPEALAELNEAIEGLRA